jgi:predicted component of type VI protein secretion system
LTTKTKNFGFTIVVVTILGILTAGCGTVDRTYEWTEYKVKADRIINPDEFAKEGTVSIINAQADDAPKLVHSFGAGRWYASYKQLTEAIVQQLTNELVKRNITVSPDAVKSIKIKVTGTDFEMGMWKWRGTLEMHLQAGNHYAKDIVVSNSTPGGVDEAFDGAVAIAVIEILNNSNIRAYLQ